MNASTPSPRPQGSSTGGGAASHAERGGYRGLSAGTPGFDEVLEGGLPAGHLYLIEGDPGAGKTTMALQFMLEGVRAGERVLYITLAESRSDLEQIARSHGWSLDGIQVQELVHSAEAATADEQYTVFRPADVELTETTKKIMEMVDRIKPSRVVIDSLSEVRLLADDPLRYRRQILGLKHFFGTRGCTVLLLDDRTVQSADFQPHSIAHGVIELGRVPNEYGAERRRLQVTKLRGRKFRGGYHDFAIRTGGVVIFPRMTTRQTDVEQKREPLASGMAEFDELLGGGLDRGTSTLLTGPAGTGKSTLAAALVNAACLRGEKAAVFAFEESPRIVIHRAASLGIDLRRHMAAGLLTFRHVLPAELSPGELAAQVREAVERDGVTAMVIDSLNGYLNAMPEERFLTAQLHELLGFLNSRGVVTIMVLAQRGMMGPGMSTPVDVSYLADTVVVLRHFEALGAVRKAISVLKKRTGRHEETIRELRMTTKESGSESGVSVGRVLSEFRGVLTGVPVYNGDNENLKKAGEPGGMDGPQARSDING